MITITSTGVKIPMWFPQPDYTAIVRITTEDELDYCLSLVKKFGLKDLYMFTGGNYEEFLALLSGVVYLAVKDRAWVIISVEEAISTKLEPDCEISDLETLLKLKST